MTKQEFLDKWAGNAANTEEFLADLDALLATEDRWYSAKEIAEIFRVNERTVHRWADDGHVPYFRVGGRDMSKRFKYSDVLAAGIVAMEDHRKDKA